MTDFLDERQNQNFKATRWVEPLESTLKHTFCIIIRFNISRPTTNTAVRRGSYTDQHPVPIRGTSTH